MMKFFLFAWLALLICISSIPIFMHTKGIYLTGRDLFFVFVGMAVMSGFSLIAVMR